MIAQIVTIYDCNILDNDHLSDFQIKMGNYSSVQLWINGNILEFNWNNIPKGHYPECIAYDQCKLYESLGAVSSIKYSSKIIRKFHTQ